MKNNSAPISEEEYNKPAQQAEEENMSKEKYIVLFIDRNNPEIQLLAGPTSRKSALKAMVYDFVEKVKDGAEKGDAVCKDVVGDVNAIVHNKGYNDFRASLCGVDAYISGSTVAYDWEIMKVSNEETSFVVIEYGCLAFKKLAEYKTLDEAKAKMHELVQETLCHFDREFEKSKDYEEGETFAWFAPEDDGAIDHIDWQILQLT